jgi:conjugal transfer pilin signal peptidase TrbI
MLMTKRSGTFTLMLSLVALILSLVALFSGAHERVVTYSPQKTITTFAKELAGAKTLSSAQKERLIRRFSTQLEASIKAYARQHQAVILSDSPVLAGGKNITNIINATLAYKMGSQERRL